MKRLTFRRFVWLASLGLTLGCGGAQSGAGGGDDSRDEGKAARVLERARQTKSIEHYRRLVLRFPDTNAATEAKDELSALLLAQAEKYLGEGDWATAEERAEEARMYAGLDLTRKARAMQQSIDEGRAVEVADRAKKQAAEGKCASALKAVATPLREKPREHFKTQLQKNSQDALVECIAKKTGQDVAAGNVDAARALVDSPDATTALSNEGHEQAKQALLKHVVAESTKEIQPLLAEKKWKEAFAKLDELTTAGKLSKTERPVADDIVRDAIARHLLKLAPEGLASKKPSAVLAEFDAAMALARFSEPPAPLAKARAELTIAVECEKERCRMTDPTPVWAWGASDLAPPSDADGKASGKVKHAQQLWQLGKAAARLLVATEDPGDAKGTALFAKASGWVDAKVVKPTDTEKWLPPSDQLPGVRIWGPLRPPSKDYHLGTVVKVEGNKAVIKRLADDQEVTVPLSSLRVGTLEKGLRVMAFCTDELKPETAKVEEEVPDPRGKPKVKIACDKGDLRRSDIAGALTTKAEWLPPRRP